MKNDVRRLSPDNIHERVDIDENGCWIWSRAIRQNRSGFKYGWVTMNNKQMSAHRASWIVHNGPIPDGMYVCHKCDVPECVNPDHLFIGTATDNMKDMWEKKRHKPTNTGGEGNPRSKLTLQAVKEIRLLLNKKVPQAVIAKKFGVTQSNISFINTGKCWGEYE